MSGSRRDLEDALFAIDRTIDTLQELQAEVDRVDTAEVLRRVRAVTDADVDTDEWRAAVASAVEEIQDEALGDAHVIVWPPDVAEEPNRYGVRRFSDGITEALRAGEGGGWSLDESRDRLSGWAVLEDGGLVWFRYSLGGLARHIAERVGQIDRAKWRGGVASSKASLELQAAVGRLCRENPGDTIAELWDAIPVRPWHEDGEETFLYRDADDSFGLSVFDDRTGNRFQVVRKKSTFRDYVDRARRTSSSG